MNKQWVKKLELHRETVRHLEDEKLGEVAAGAPSQGPCIEPIRRTDPRTTC